VPMADARLPDGRTAAPVVDPVTLEIVRGSLSSTIRDMELLMERCAMSPFIKEKKDYFVGIFDPRGRIVACHISGSGPGMLEAILRAYPLDGMRPGDVYWFNDPYVSDGAVQHHQDMVFVVPVFHEGQVVAFAATFGHYQDIGGLRAGSISPHATRSTTRACSCPPCGSCVRASSTRRRTGSSSATRGCPISSRATRAP